MKSGLVGSSFLKFRNCGFGQEGEDGKLDSSDDGDETTRTRCRRAPRPPKAEEPPEGFTYAACPTLESEQQHRELIGRMVLVAHDRTKDLEANWYVGKIKLYGVSPMWKRFSGNPKANFMIKYTKKLKRAMRWKATTGGGAHIGQLYGPREWWLLLKPITL